MRGFVQDIEGLAVKNDDFRQVLFAIRDLAFAVIQDDRCKIGAPPCIFHSALPF